MYLTTDVGSENNITPSLPLRHLCSLWFESGSQVERPECEYVFLLLYPEQSSSVIWNTFFFIDFNINDCYFSDIVSKLNNLFFKEQHLSVSSIKNVWDKSESYVDQLFTLSQGLKCEITISIMIRLVLPFCECIICTLGLKMISLTMDFCMPFWFSFSAFSSQASLTPMTKERREV